MFGMLLSCCIFSYNWAFCERTRRRTK